MGVPLGPAARAAVSQAKRLPLGRPDVHGMTSAQASVLTRAAEQAALHSFHLGMAIAGLLVAAGGVVEVVGIRDPKREVRAEHPGAARSSARASTRRGAPSSPSLS